MCVCVHVEMCVGVGLTVHPDQVIVQLLDLVSLGGSLAGLTGQLKLQRDCPHQTRAYT